MRHALRTLILGLVSLTAGTSVAQDAAPASPPAEPPLEAVYDREDIRVLLTEVSRLRADLRAMEQELAAARVEAIRAARELEELQAFVRDHERFGDDFERYREFVESREAAARREAIERRRAEAERERAERLASQREAARRRQAERAEAERVERYEDAGFRPLGLDVFLGRAGYAYLTEESGVAVEYEPIVGFFYRPLDTQRLDFTRMRLSGSVLNASDVVRNVGVAVAFFDREGNQIGSETIQVNNARPNVPYPFNTTVEMASHAPFASSTSWVLYADPVVPAETEEARFPAGGDRAPVGGAAEDGGAAGEG